MKELIQKQLEMMARGDHEEIMDFLSETHFVSKDTALALIKRGNHEEIITYVSKNCLCKDSELALIKRGNHEEIMAYIATDFSFNPQAEIALIERKNREEVTAYHERHSFSKKAQKAYPVTLYRLLH